jgi:phage-related protein
VSAQSTLLTLYSKGGVINLKDYVNTDFIFSNSGATGFGIPSFGQSYFDGAGDGSVYRNTVVQKREITFPIFIQAKSRQSLIALIRKLEHTLNRRYAPATLAIGDIREANLFLKVTMSSFTDYQFGETTNDKTWLKCALTLTAGDPFYYSDDTVTIEPYGDLSSNWGLLSPFSLAELRLNPAESYKEQIVYNPGTEKAYPVWKIEGECTRFSIKNENGDELKWEGEINAGECLIVDTAEATIFDSNGTDRYEELKSVPRFFALDPGYSHLYFYASNGVWLSLVTGTFRKRYLAMV